MGEAEFGLIDGVLATEAGWHEGREVVTVRFDPEQIGFDALLERAVDRRCTTAGVWTTTKAQHEVARATLGKRAKRLTGTPRPDKEPKYRLFRSAYRALPLTELQAVRINARLGAGKPFEELLSPRQRAAAERIRKHPQAKWPQLVGVELAEAWERFDAFVPKAASAPQKRR